MAQRLGVEDFHSKDLYDSEVIAALNEYGVRESLFEADSHMARTLFLVESPDSKTLRMNHLHTDGNTSKS